MSELGDVIDINSILRNYGLKYEGENFEEYYSNLVENTQNKEMILQIEDTIHSYFSALELPDTRTVYDYLVLSLREKDVIATFNWDPLLFQTLLRNKQFPLPHILFLHGNVALGYCYSEDHKVMGTYGANCPECGKRFRQTKLLYPITNKDYLNDPFIKDQWETLEKVIDHTFIFTIFGYSAPQTDVNAKKLMEKAWDRSDNKDMGEIEIINIEERDKLHLDWSPFIVRSHYRIYESFFDSLAHRWPRRSCEKIWNQFFLLRLTKENHQPKDVDLFTLQEWHLSLVNAEKEKIRLEKAKKKSQNKA